MKIRKPTEKIIMKKENTRTGELSKKLDNLSRKVETIIDFLKK